MLTFCISRVRVRASIRGAVPVSGRTISVILLLPRRGAVIRVAARIVSFVHVLIIVAAKSARHLDTRAAASTSNCLLPSRKSTLRGRYSRRSAMQATSHDPAELVAAVALCRLHSTGHHRCGPC